MKQRNLHSLAVTLFALCFSLSATAAERVFTPIAEDGQEVRYVDGETMLVASTPTAGLALSFVGRDKKTAWVKVWVENRGDHPFNVGDTSVTATSGGAPLLVDTYASRLKEQKRQEMWAGVAAGFAAAGNNMAASNAGYSQTNGTYNSRTNASAYGTGGYTNATATTNGSYSGTTYNAYDAQRAQADANARNQQMFAQNRANAAFAQQDLKDRALKMNTLMPGQSVLGDVRFSLPKRSKETPAEFTIFIDVDGVPVRVRYREGG